MVRATRILAVTTAVGLAASVYLYLDNRSLKAELAERPSTESTEPVKKVASTEAAPSADTWADPEKRSAKLPNIPSTPPQLPEEKQESRMERRQRRTEEFAAKFGRLDGETDEEYRARIGPLISAGLAIPRMRATENRRVAEEKAGVTPEQSKQLDAAFDKVYADVLDYTNKAITDGQLSPYERNVAGWLDYAGGLGGMLGEANGQIGKILTPEQLNAMASSGFEWGEYLGFNAPWEKLQPPPPPKPGN
jgi:type IV secretory pathway VirB10-like protein